MEGFGLLLVEATGILVDVYADVVVAVAVAAAPLVCGPGKNSSGGILVAKYVLLERSTLQRLPEQQEPTRVRAEPPFVTLVQSSS